MCFFLPFFFWVMAVMCGCGCAVYRAVYRARLSMGNGRATDVASCKSSSILLHHDWSSAFEYATMSIDRLLCDLKGIPSRRAYPRSLRSSVDRVRAVDYSFAHGILRIRRLRPRAKRRTTPITHVSQYCSTSSSIPFSFPSHSHCN